MHENKKMRRLDPIAANMLGKEGFFGPNSLQILENRIFDLTGSKVQFSSTLHRVPSFNELEKAKQRGDKLIFLPDTMFVTVQRGEEVTNPRPSPITIENLFELFYSQTEAKTILRIANESEKEMSVRVIPSKQLPKKLIGREERRKVALNKLTILIQKFEGGILNLGGLLSILSTDYNKSISGGYHFIKRLINDKQIDFNSFMSENKSRLPSVLELFVIQLILSANNMSSDEGTWLPTNSPTEISVEEPNTDPHRATFSELKHNKVAGRIFVTNGSQKGVGLATLRDDIAQYRQHVLAIK